MNFLLDTHVWLWSILEPARLNQATRTALTDPQHRFFLSPISVWETILLIEKGRVLVFMELPVWLDSVLWTSHIQEAPLTPAVALRSRMLQLPHQDPADRFIAATALEYGFTLLTAEQHLLGADELTVWPAA